MGIWRATLDIKAEWIATEEDKEKVTALVGKVVSWMRGRLAAGIFKDDAALSCLRIDFESMLYDAEHTRSKKKWGKTRIAEFDRLWKKLYDWCDANRVWIKTF